VALCTPPFRALSFRRRESLGLAELPVIFLPHPMMTRTSGEIEEIADEALKEIVQSLVAGAS
jgi:hypothetical protein